MFDYKIRFLLCASSKSLVNDITSTKYGGTDWLCRWGWDVSEPWLPTRLLFIPQVICECGKPWWRCQLGKTDSSTRAPWQSYQQRHLGASRRNGRSQNFAYSVSEILKGSLTWRKILRYGTSSFTSIRKKMCCEILSSLKIDCLGWVWNRNPWVQWQAH
jgi:hypothetical protein